MINPTKIDFCRVFCKKGWYSFQRFLVPLLITFKCCIVLEQSYGLFSIEMLIN